MNLRHGAAGLGQGQQPALTIIMKVHQVQPKASCQYQKPSHYPTDAGQLQQNLGQLLQVLVYAVQQAGAQ
jgi:hypothetical protein